jgi:hypothetical protein
MYPNGIDVSDDGDILVGDSHGNHFHVAIFDRNGKVRAIANTYFISASF